MHYVQQAYLSLAQSFSDIQYHKYILLDFFPNQYLVCDIPISALFRNSQGSLLHLISSLTSAHASELQSSQEEKERHVTKQHLAFCNQLMSNIVVITFPLCIQQK